MVLLAAYEINIGLDAKSVVKNKPESLAGLWVIISSIIAIDNRR